MWTSTEGLCGEFERIPRKPKGKGTHPTVHGVTCTRGVVSVSRSLNVVSANVKIWLSSSLPSRRPGSRVVEWSRVRHVE